MSSHRPSATESSPATPRPSSLCNAFTVDVEDYFQVTGFERHIHRDAWRGFESRVEWSTQRILDLLDDHSVQGTVVILGWVAERFPGLVAEIARRGHEVGSHSHWHRLIYELSPAEFRDDVRRSRDTLQELIGQPVTAYRAPSFSVTRDSLWALEILVEEGFTVDSSVFPVIHDRYGIPHAPRSIHRIETPAGSMWEFPPSVVRQGGVNWPVSGGGYFRLYPTAMTHAFLRRVNRQSNQPFMFYIHPWEVDPGQPRLKAGSRLSRWRHYLNLHRTESKLNQLLKRFRFGTMQQVIADFQQRSAGEVRVCTVSGTGYRRRLETVGPVAKSAMAFNAETDG
ncbi:MAG: XrtA system polysaccharide deacetylase [Planctomycetota bacterium]